MPPDCEAFFNQFKMPQWILPCIAFILALYNLAWCDIDFPLYLYPLLCYISLENVDFAYLPLHLITAKNI